MYKILIALIAILVPIQFFGLFYTSARQSGDFLFSPQSEKSANISLISLETQPTNAQLERVIRLANQGNPTVIGLEVEQNNVRAQTNVVNLKQYKKEQYLDKDGKVRTTYCTDSFALQIAKKINSSFSCLEEPLVINYSLTEENIDILSLADLEAGKRTETPVVIIGLNSKEDKIFETPISKVHVSSMVVTANAVDTIITERQLRTIPPLLDITISVAIFVLFGIIISRRKFFTGLLVLVFLILLDVVLVWILYLYNVQADLFYIPIGLTVIYVGLLAWGYFEQNRYKIYIQNAFGKYLNKKVLNELLKDPTKLKLGGEKKTISILIADMKSFTTISESTRVDKLIKTLNNFLSFVTDTVIEQDGTLDKYVGDEVIAFWNAPLDQEDHAVMAAHAAIKIKKGMEKVIKGGFGIGLNTGLAFVGNVGSQHLYDYTAIGDSVNITARLEHLTRSYGVTILASESFVKAVTSRPAGNQFQFNKLDSIVLKGKTHPVLVYELEGYV